MVVLPFLCKYIILACCFFQYILAESNIVYSVINASPKYNIAVIIKNGTYSLQPSVESNILFQGLAPANSPYSYALFDKSTNKLISREEFDRPAVSSNTPNEFYGRSWNKKPLVTFNTVPNIPRHFNRRSDENLHPPGEIPTIHVSAPQSSFDNLHDHYFEDIEIKANITYIKGDSVKTFIDAKFEIGGRSSRLYTKFAYNIKLDKKSDDDIDGYKKLKLRTTVSDPSYMRDYLASEMLYAVNQPATRASYVRVFLNDRPVGLYTIMEKYDKAWLTNEFANGSKDYNYGTLYEGEGGKTPQNRASLEYLGDDPAAYSNAAYSISEKPKVGIESFDDLVQFTKFIHDQLEFQKQATQEQLSASVAEWKKQFEVEGFLVSLAVEFMSGFWDNYALNTNNYFMYKCPDTQKFYYITWDYDLSFGSGPVSMKKLRVGDYRAYLGYEKRPLTTALLNVPEFVTLFERHLQSIVDNLYIPQQINAVVDSVVNLIQDDVEWDKSLPHIRKGAEFMPFSLDNLINHNFLTPSKNIGTPPILSLTTAADYLIRVNSNVPFKNAVEGNTGHVSLYGIKEWVNVKLDNYKKNTTYKPLIPFLPLK